MSAITIRPEIPADIPAIFNVNLRAFGQPAEAELVNALRREGDFIPELSMVAVDGGIIAGHILFPPISIDSPAGRVPALALAPMAVLPEYQHRGIGSQLVRHGLAACRRLGHHIVVLVGHPDYYLRFGFMPARRYGIEAPFPVPDEAFMVLGLDEGALDGIRGTVRYPGGFDAVSGQGK
ncbi:MAG: N-acetyltransferase [Methanoregula sp.]|nr:MAG: N-acetyltransferase [Methanoregula sp.]